MSDVGSPDPEGYYVLVFKSDIREEIVKLSYSKGFITEEQGGIIIVRVKSRSAAKKILRKFRRYRVF
mgnify:CR=1 FL=1